MADVKAEEVDVKNVKLENSNGETTKLSVSHDEPNELEKKIIRQIEYYFGDYNLPRDKFLLEEIKYDDGWIPFETLFKFKRLASLSTDKEVVIAALEKSETQLVKVNDERTKLRRVPEYPIPELNNERRMELLQRSAYIKGFPTDKRTDDILLFFENNNVSVASVHLRFVCDKATKQFVFRGSVFATFKTVEECKKFIESGPYKYDSGPDLLVKWQSVYLEDKRKEYAEHKQAHVKSRQAAKEAEAEEKETELPACSIIHLDGFTKTVVREDIKKALEDLGANVAYIEFYKGEEEAFVRLPGETAAADFMETLKEKENIIEVNGLQIRVRAIEGDELIQRLDKIKQDIKKHKSFMSYKRKSKGRGGRGGSGNKGGNRKRRAEKHEDEPTEKKTD